MRQTPITALLVEDNPTDVLLTTAALASSPNVTCLQASRFAEAAEILHRQAVDLVLLDLGLPDSAGLETLHRVRATAPHAAVIVLTGQDDFALGVEAVQAGAQDYLVKGQSQSDALVRAAFYAVERHRALEALARSEERFRLLVEGARDYAIYLLDADGVVVSWNLGAERMFGFTASRIVGSHYSAFFLDEDRNAGVPEALLQRAALDGTAHAEGWRARADGTRFWCEGVVTALRVDGGELRGFSKVARDLTERRRLEEHLRHAQRMEAVGQLAGGVAHDFNNLLTVIMGESDMLLFDLPSGDPRRVAVSDIRDAASRASNLTRQLLAFSRKQVLASRIVDLNVIVSAVERMLRRLIGEDIVLTTMLDPALDKVRVDPGQIEQVLMNLAVNARDAMPRGGRLTIETGNIDADATRATQLNCAQGRHVSLSVADTGTGMDHATLVRIFEPFFTTKAAGAGTGLGLATVHGIVAQSGGCIAVQTVLGTGTTFTILLPSVDSDGADGGDLLRAAPGAETVLLVEDDSRVRRISRLALEAHGYKVLEAASAADAMTQADHHAGDIHLVLADVVLPDANGRELVTRVLALHAHARVLFMSGYVDDASARHGLADLGDTFLQKPFSSVELARRVREVLDA